MLSQKNSKIAIMQPTFIPWIGYFALINHVDLFVFLDHVQFDKRSWQQRNKIKTPEGLKWLTVPVLSKGKFSQPIIDVNIDPSSSFAEKATKALTSNYCKAKFFDKYSQDIFKIIQRNDSKLAELNITLIQYINDVWSIKTPIYRSSNLNIKGTKDELLFNICKVLKGDIYISPLGAHSYLDNSNFFGGNIGQKKLLYFNYFHPIWDQQYGDFLPYCSALDLLFNFGSEGISYIKNDANYNLSD